MKKIYILLICMLTFTSVKSQHSTLRGAGSNSRVFRSVVQEVLHTSMYTYLNVRNDTTDAWLAIPRTELSVGDTVYHLAGMEMKNFQSKELKRTFPSVIFMDFVSRTRDGAFKKDTKIPEHQQKPKVERQEIQINPAEGGISIAELYRNRESYAGKLVKVRGQVVKYNDSILKKNWVHIQDGSRFGEEFDLTVTMDETVSTGDIIVVEGTVSLNKDFGSGYFFNLIMENARLIK